MEPADAPRNLKIVRAFFWLVTICAGFLQTWAARFSVSPDGNSYLDIASAYLRGDFKNAVNAYWSPFFSWLLALCLAVFRPGPDWESTLLHLLNFVALLLSLLSFEFFFRAFLKAKKQLAGTGVQTEDLPEFAWWALGYGLFLSTSLYILTVTLTTPDICVAVATYLVAGLILRIFVNDGGWRLFAVLGFVLGCAYLAKTFYFLMSFVFLSAAWVATENPRKTIKQATIALAMFVLVAGPWVMVLSRAKNRITFGDVGKLALTITIDQLQQPFVWQGEKETGIPQHPVRQLLTKPRLYEFGTPVGGSYPPAFDPSYWMEGARPRFRLGGLLRVLRQSAGTMFQFLAGQIEYAVGLLFLFFLVRREFSWVVLFREQWFLWMPPLLACLAYALVLVEGRYVAPFILLLWIAAFSCLLSSPSQLSSRAKLALVLALLSATGLRLAKSATSDVFAVQAGQTHTDFEVAQALHNLGLQRGEKVAGLSRVAEAYWAHLAGVEIVSEIPLGDDGIFWAASSQEKRKVFEVFAATGAAVVVTKDPPVGAIKEGWIPLGNTAFYAYPLRPNLIDLNSGSSAK
jgi:4-amino-4-deoxy-L-arabinose transferase-like glycosyltransferase